MLWFKFFFGLIYSNLICIKDIGGKKKKEKKDAKGVPTEKSLIFILSWPQFDFSLISESLPYSETKENKNQTGLKKKNLNHNT